MQNIAIEIDLLIFSKDLLLQLIFNGLNRDLIMHSKTIKNEEYRYPINVLVIVFFFGIKISNTNSVINIWPLNMRCSIN